MEANDCIHDSEDSGDEDESGRSASAKANHQQMTDFESDMLDDDVNQIKELVFDYLRMKYTGHRNARYINIMLCHTSRSVSV